MYSLLPCKGTRKDEVQAEWRLTVESVVILVLLIIIIGVGRH
jgi:hypothetical protein